MYLVYNILYASIIWGYSSDGRVFDWQSKGHGFEPRYLHQLFFPYFFYNKTVIIMTLINLERNNNFVL